MDKKAQEKQTEKSKAVAGAAAAAALVTLSSAAVVKAVAATATLPVLTRLLKAIEITINTSLDFGTLAFTADQAGTARLDPVTGTLVPDANNSLTQAGGKPRPGRIRIKGFAAPVQVSVEQQAIQLSNGEDFLTIDNFRFINNTIGSRVTITPNATANSIVIPVGATVRTKVGQLSGTYIGSNRVFANYQ